MGIPLGPADFTRGAAKPLDDTFLKADQAARNAIVAGVRYLGLQVHVIADNQTYELKGGILDANWSPIGGGSTPLPVVDSFTGNGATVAFTLTATPGTKENIIVFIDGLRQSTANYSVSGTTLTFVIAPGNLRAIQTITGSVNTVNVPAASSVLTASILDGAVTQSKKEIRAVGTSVGAGGIAKSATSGTYSHSTTTEQDITNLSVTITTLGNPVEIELIPDETNVKSFVEVYCSTPGFPHGKIYLYRGATYLGEINIATVIPTGAVRLTLPPAVVKFSNHPAAGTYVYKLRSATGDTTTTLNIEKCKLRVYEI